MTTFDILCCITAAIVGIWWVYTELHDFRKRKRVDEVQKKKIEEFEELIRERRKKGMNMIAQGGGYTVQEYNGTYLVKGLVAGITVAFNNRDEWNLMMAVLKIADAQINGVDE